ncbi:calcium-activated potassium channel subunit beta-2 isoform X2 [Rhincodon typus]|uniref:calcium-activated potassium channel subunit beta-2 isoform X2 n=1 Tax=Rhincodon typus TaxID=259920 RepID=UPI00202F63BB|nr:calcium-activated potassium channel subunit beta-2 isoform X2 [Rhincodon typus]
MLRDKTDFFLKDPRKNLGSLRHNVISSSSVRYTSSRSEPTMFLWSRQQHRGQQGRCCICSCPLTDYMERCEGQRPLIEGICDRNYKKVTGREALEKCKMVSALKAGEDRAIFLGLGMLVCSIVVAFLLASRLVQSHKDSVWTQESTCTVLETRITNCKKCIHNCVSKCWKPSEYPCVQIYVNLSSTGSRVLLHHTHESVRFNPECFCATKCSKNRAETEMLIASITENSTQFQPISFPCYYDPEGRQNNVLLTRFDLSNAMLHLSFWPSCIFLGGIVIIVMVKLTQYLSLLSEQSQMRKK